MLRNFPLWLVGLLSGAFALLVLVLTVEDLRNSRPKDTKLTIVSPERTSVLPELHKGLEDDVRVGKETSLPSIEVLRITRLVFDLEGQDSVSAVIFTFKVTEGFEITANQVQVTCDGVKVMTSSSTMPTHGGEGTVRPVNSLIFSGDCAIGMQTTIKSPKGGAGQVLSQSWEFPEAVKPAAEQKKE